MIFLHLHRESPRTGSAGRKPLGSFMQGRRTRSQTSRIPSAILLIISEMPWKLKPFLRFSLKEIHTQRLLHEAEPSLCSSLSHILRHEPIARKKRRPMRIKHIVHHEAPRGHAEGADRSARLLRLTRSSLRGTRSVRDPCRIYLRKQGRYGAHSQRARTTRACCRRGRCPNP